MAVDTLIRAGLDTLGLSGAVSPDAPARMDRYCALLLEQNEVMNLTAITQPEDVASLHMLDSAALLACPSVSWEGRLLDVGSGAGLPGLALKLLRPDLDVTLLDSQRKRVDWLNTVCRALSLDGVSAIHARAETAGQDPALRERFDLVTARAVAELRLLCELCLPFVRVGGVFLAMKGPDPGEELESARTAAELLGGRVREPFRYAVPGTDAVHSVIAVEKLVPTPKKYPRRWNQIKNSLI